ncbi:hypothetical protein EDB19DRAFT_1824030 [Suillus lakei]|nr:hypothetical protein EDB19DRAFT_1824030 [Suillus lakei]
MSVRLRMKLQPTLRVGRRTQITSEVFGPASRPAIVKIHAVHYTFMNDNPIVMKASTIVISARISRHIIVPGKEPWVFIYIELLRDARANFSELQCAGKFRAYRLKTPHAPAENLERSGQIYLGRSWYRGQGGLGCGKLVKDVTSNAEQNIERWSKMSDIWPPWQEHGLAEGCDYSRRTECVVEQTRIEPDKASMDWNEGRRTALREHREFTGSFGKMTVRWKERRLIKIKYLGSASHAKRLYDSCSRETQEMAKISGLCDSIVCLSRSAIIGQLSQY